MNIETGNLLYQWVSCKTQPAGSVTHATRALYRPVGNGPDDSPSIRIGEMGQLSPKRPRACFWTCAKASSTESVKQSIDEWVCAAEITDGKLFRAIRKNGVIWGHGVTQNVVWYVVKQCAERAGIRNLAPHDLRSYAEF